MKELILLLFFGKSVLLTPVPVTVGPGCITLQPQKTLRVINSGAALEIHIPPTANDNSKQVNIVSASGDMQKMYPVGSVSAMLFRDDGSRVLAVNTDVGTGNNFYELNLRPPLPQNSPKGIVPAYQDGDKFVSVTMCSKNPIPAAQIYWQTATE